MPINTPVKDGASEWTALDRLKEAFHFLAPVFQDFNQTTGTYYEQERAYKQDLLDNYASILSAALQNPALGEALYQAAIPKGGGVMLWAQNSGMEPMQQRDIRNGK